MLYDLSKDEILSILEGIDQEAQQFEQDKNNDSHSVKSIFFSWVGFCLKPDLHPYMKKFDIDKCQFPPFFQLTSSGEPINMGQQSVKISLNTKI